MPTPAQIKACATKEDDFGHEMRIGRVIHSIPAINVQHGGTYTDSVTGKPRQFDFRCRIHKGNQALALAVECKNLNSSSPLMLCGTARREMESAHFLIEARNGNFKRGSHTLLGQSSVTFRVNPPSPFYPPNEFVGKSILRYQDPTSSVRATDSDVYERWAQALSSSVEIAETACRTALSLKVETFRTAILPIVVVPDDLLWAVDYDRSGSIVTDPSPLNECQLFVGREIEVGGEIRTPLFHTFVFTHIHFFTLRGFDSFLNKMNANERAWKFLFPEDAIEI